MAAKDADDAPLRERLAALEAVLVVVLADNERLRARVAELEAENERLTAKVADLEEERGRHSGTSSKPPSSDTLAQRAKQVEARPRSPTWRRNGADTRRGAASGLVRAVELLSASA